MSDETVDIGTNGQKGKCTGKRKPQRPCTLPHWLAFFIKKGCSVMTDKDWDLASRKSTVLVLGYYYLIGAFKIGRVYAYKHFGNTHIHLMSLLGMFQRERPHLWRIERHKTSICIFDL